jgi:hypothetical protein
VFFSIQVFCILLLSVSFYWTPDLIHLDFIVLKIFDEEYELHTLTYTSGNVWMKALHRVAAQRTV